MGAKRLYRFNKINRISTPDLRRGTKVIARARAPGLKSHCGESRSRRKLLMWWSESLVSGVDFGLTDAATSFVGDRKG
jgi:hypothetical protein